MAYGFSVNHKLFFEDRHSNDLANIIINIQNTSLLSNLSPDVHKCIAMPSQTANTVALYYIITLYIPVLQTCEVCRGTDKDIRK